MASDPKPATSRLDVRVGYCSEPGPRDENQDFGVVLLGTPEMRASHGVIAVVTDGVSSMKNGRVAAELAARGFIDGFLAQKETLPVHKSAAISFSSIAEWIARQGRRDKSGMASTLTALILRGRRAYGVHIGDSRLYRFSEEGLVQLTTDHNPDEPAMKNTLTRAIGISESERADFIETRARPFDRFLLTSDGVSNPLSQRRIGEILALRAAPEETARLLVASALEAGGTDNATALLIDIVSVPPADRADLAAELERLPILPLPVQGEQIDQYLLDDVIADTQFNRIFRATDLTNGKQQILKFPNPEFASGTALRHAYLREAWLSSRVQSRYLGETHDPDPQRQSRLYTVMTYHPGETLEARLQRPPKVGLAEGIAIAEKLVRGVASLHRAGIIHRDIKPLNIILESGPGGSGLRLIDLGLARVLAIEEADAKPEARVPGTPSYMAPELFAAAKGDIASDIYAIGVTLYRMFTGGEFPYGENKSFSAPRSPLTPLVRRRPDLPAWLDAALTKAVAPDPDERFDDTVELLLTLERGDVYTPPTPGKTSFYQRNPLLAWQLIACALLAALVWSLAVK